MVNKVKILDLFCGVGGLSYGFSQDNSFEIIAANEILPAMAKAYSLNHCNVKLYCKDIKDFGISYLKKDLNIKKGDIDLIIGGPPCQSYSTIGKRLIDDPRGRLFQEYYRVLKEVNPKMFVFENVKGLLSMQKGKVFNNIISLFKSLNYNVFFKTLNAADYGVPQVRERVFIVGSKINDNFQFPKATHTAYQNAALSFENLEAHLTVGEAIGDLPLIGSGGESFCYKSKAQNNFQFRMRKNTQENILDHNAPNNNKNLVEIMKLLPDGGTPLDLPEKLRPKSGFANTYSKLWWKRPSTTITRNFSTPSSSRCVHPKGARPLTTREGARLQSFPDDYIFYGSRSDKNLQIGNAVPPFLSIALKESILQHFAKSDIEYSKVFLENAF